MTTREARGISAVESEEEAIARYLQHHPDFFERHQGLLTRLRLPHSHGGSTISLVERQIEVMRERHATLETKLSELLRVARENEAIAARFHCFSRRLLRARTRAEALSQIESSLHDDFDAFHPVLLVISDAPQESPARFARLIASDDPNLKSFASLFASARPRCGQLRPA